MPLKRILSASHADFLTSSMEALAGRYFLLVEHCVAMPRSKGEGISLGYVEDTLPKLLQRMRQHDSQGRLPADDSEALAYIKRWLAAWPQTESGRRWAKPPAATADG